MLDTVVEAVAPSFSKHHYRLLFGEIMKLADEPRKKLSEWRRKAADISTQIKHDKRTVNAEALRRTDAWFDGGLGAVPGARAGPRGGPRDRGERGR